ncbi:MAG: hypothetical protein AB7E12_10455 [Burkholderiaceae bacterium]
MNADADLHVWLETQHQPEQVIPYVMSRNEQTVRYQIDVFTSNSHGKSQVRQGGKVWLSANQPTPLSRLSITPRPFGRCTLNVAISQEGQPERTYDFDCPAVGNGQRQH